VVVLAVEEIMITVWIKRLLLAGALAVVAWILWNYVFISDATRVKRGLEAMRQAVEKGRLLWLSEKLATDYQDAYGMDRSTLLAAISSFRSQYDSISISLRNLTVTVEPDGQKAEARFIVKVTAAPKGSAEPQSEIRAERLRVLFRKTDSGWKLFYAETPELKFE
jgi:hypothetical protein